MAINKVVYNGNTLIDLTSDTVTASTLLEGYTAHDKSGVTIVGTASGGSEAGSVWQDAQGYVHLSDETGTPLQNKTVSPSTSSQTIRADAGYYGLGVVTVSAVPVYNGEFQ